MDAPRLAASPTHILAAMIGSTPRYVIDGHPGNCRPQGAVHVTPEESTPVEVLCQRK